MNSLKKLLPFAVVGVLSGATTFGAIKYFDNNNGNNGDFHISMKQKMMHSLQELALQMEKIL
jgi:hypothetical protein